MTAFVDGAGDTATSTTTNLTSGYYLVSVNFYEGPAVSANKVWGGIEAARIMDGYESSKTYTLVAGQVQGHLEVIIVENMLDPVISITFSGNVPILYKSLGDTMTVTVDLATGISPAVADTPEVDYDAYLWYNEGVATSNTTNSITFDATTLPIGYYTYDFVITRKEQVGASPDASDPVLMYASERLAFEVME